MVRYTGGSRHKRRRGSLRRPAGVRQNPRMQTKGKMRKSAGGLQGAVEFLRRNIKAVAIVFAVLVLAGVALGIVFGGKKTPGEPNVTPQVSEVVLTDAPEDEFTEFSEEAGYDYESVDDSVLAGLAGSDDSLFSDPDEEMEDAILAEEGIRIGVTVGDLKSDTDQAMLGTMEQASNAAEESKLVYEVYYYNAQGDFNQQLQDVRSLIKNEVDVIIVGGSTKKSVDMVVSLASEAGIPVVAYDAPAGTSGYAVNIVADQAAWGNVYGEFMAKNLTSGRIVQIFGSDTDVLDLERAAAINAALATNENISVKDTLYGKWDSDDAYDAIKEYLEENGYVQGIITEEGMAKGILDAFIQIKRLPVVMCGDASAGFIKTWYALKTKGIDITPKPEDDEEVVATVILKSKPSEMIVIAQPAPVSIGAVAFEVAYQLALGRTMKVLGATFVYNVETIITDSTLPKYYGMIWDEADDVLLRDIVAQETIESLLNPPKETVE